MTAAMTPTKAKSAESRPVRSARLGLRATPEQEAVLRRAAELSHRSMTDFILESACQAAQQTLLDQRLFMIPGERYQTMLDLLDQPPGPNAGLQDLFSKPAPWDQPASEPGDRVD